MPLILAPFEERIRVSQTLSGAKDGSNRTFTTDEPFVENTIELRHNGRMLEKTAAGSPAEGDYFVGESGGPGTGFDSVTLIRIKPGATSRLLGNFVVDD